MIGALMSSDRVQNFLWSILALYLLYNVFKCTVLSNVGTDLPYISALQPSILKSRCLSVQSFKDLKMFLHFLNTQYSIVNIHLLR